MKTDDNLDWHVRRAMQEGIKACHLPMDRISDHGIDHWLRVYRNARLIAANMPTGANLRIAAWFAFLHDCKREDDFRDPDHGPRAAKHANSLIPAEGIPLTPRELEYLAFAIEHHSTGLMEGPIECRICWDADRLDLWRVGIQPDPKRMTTTIGARIAHNKGWAR